MTAPPKLAASARQRAAGNGVGMIGLLWRWIREGTHQVDSDFYLREYPDVARSPISPDHHYVRHGALEGRVPNERVKVVRLYGFWRGRWKPLTGGRDHALAGCFGEHACRGMQCAVQAKGPMAHGGLGELTARTTGGILREE